MSDPSVPSVIGQPRTWLPLEGAALAIGGVVAYLAIGGNWLLGILLLIAPDLSTVGYLADTRIGALVYDLGHNLVVPLALAGLPWWLGSPAAGSVAAALIAHVGFDRALGYGLKYRARSGDTHLGRIGRAA